MAWAVEPLGAGVQLDGAAEMGAVDGEDAELAGGVLDRVGGEGDLAGSVVTAAVLHHEAGVLGGFELHGGTVLDLVERLVQSDRQVLLLGGSLGRIDVDEEGHQDGDHGGRKQAGQVPDDEVPPGYGPTQRSRRARLIYFACDGCGLRSGGIASGRNLP